MLDFSSDSEDDDLPHVPTEDNFGPVDVKMLPKFRSIRRHARTEDGKRGQAKDPLEEQLFLRIGPSTFSGMSTEHADDSSFAPDDDIYMVSESPGAADVDIYETAYRDEIERILARAKEQEKEPQVYLTRRVDQRLLAMSGRAGKWMAGAEEAASNIDSYTQFSARRARVTEVSRALRQAAKEEYDRRRQEKRDMIAKVKADKGKAKESQSETPTATPEPMSPDVVESPAAMTPPASRYSGTVLRGKAADKGREARKSLKGIVDIMKNRRTKSKDDAL